MSFLFRFYLKHIVLQTCMQGDITKETYGTLSQTASKLMKEGGVMRFFNGWGWRTGRMILGTFILNEGKNRLGPIMFPELFKDEVN